MGPPMVTGELGGGCGENHSNPPSPDPRAPPAVPPEGLDLDGMRAKLADPLAPRQVAHNEPALVVLEPQSPSMMILVGRVPVGHPLGCFRQLVHLGPRGDVLGGVRALGVVG